MLGYVLFCLLFTYYIRFAAHYHLQLVFIVALWLGALGHALIQRLGMRLSGDQVRLLMTAVLALSVLYHINVIRPNLDHARYERREVAEAIGKIVGHSRHTVFIASYYGRPLEYFGQLSGTFWPRREEHWAYQNAGSTALSVEDRLQNLGFSPEYFVITDFSEYRNHHGDLQNYLTTNGRLVAENDAYLVYSLERVD
jgi:hypothetical protein